MHNVIQIWLSMTVDDQRLSHYVMGEAVGNFLEVFYGDNGMVNYRDS